MFCVTERDGRGDKAHRLHTSPVCNGRFDCAISVEFGRVRAHRPLQTPFTQNYRLRQFLQDEVLHALTRTHLLKYLVENLQSKGKVSRVKIRRSSLKVSTIMAATASKFEMSSTEDISA